MYQYESVRGNISLICRLRALAKRLTRNSTSRLVSLSTEDYTLKEASRSVPPFWQVYDSPRAVEFHRRLRVHVTKQDDIAALSMCNSTFMCRFIDAPALLYNVMYS